MLGYLVEGRVRICVVVQVIIIVPTASTELFN